MALKWRFVYGIIGILRRWLMHVEVLPTCSYLASLHKKPVEDIKSTWICRLKYSRIAMQSKIYQLEAHLSVDTWNWWAY